MDGLPWALIASQPGVSCWPPACSLPTPGLQLLLASSYAHSCLISGEAKAREVGSSLKGDQAPGPGLSCECWCWRGRGSRGRCRPTRYAETVSVSMAWLPHPHPASHCAPCTSPACLPNSHLGFKASCPVSWDPTLEGGGESTTPFRRQRGGPPAALPAQPQPHPCSFPWTWGPATLHIAPSRVGLAAYPLAENFTPLGLFPFP